LRGFKARNLGCRHELGVLATAAHLQRVVLLFDASTDRSTAATDLAGAPAGRIVWIEAGRLQQKRVAQIVGALLGAVDSGDVRLIDREQVRKTKRQLFGITMPDIDILKTDDNAEAEVSELFETTIASGRQTGPTTWRFTTAEGAVWEINNPPRKLAPINAGDKVAFKRASLGYYFIRINGQIGVKGRRVV
jgi:hypothetical protein